MKHEMMDEQESELDELKWLHDESLQDEIAIRRAEFDEAVKDLREEMKDDIKELRAESRAELKEEIKELKTSWGW